MFRLIELALQIGVLLRKAPNIRRLLMLPVDELYLTQ